MNTRKVKLALTVGLINKCAKCNPIQAVKDVMGATKEVGSFIKSSIVSQRQLDTYNQAAVYALEFENCTLNLDLVVNRHTRNQYVNGFQLN
ncbi:MAG: hypothetical protein AB8G22_25840 [Saprospiraceae bacterium]